MIQDYQEQMSRIQEKRYLLNLDYLELKEESENPELILEDYNIYYENLKLENTNKQLEYMNDLLAKIKWDKIIIIITHRKYLLSMCDEIITLNA